MPRIIIDHSRPNVASDTLSQVGQAAGGLASFLVNQRQLNDRTRLADRSLDLDERRLSLAERREVRDAEEWEVRRGMLVQQAEAALQRNALDIGLGEANLSLLRQRIASSDPAAQASSLSEMAGLGLRLYGDPRFAELADLVSSGRLGADQFSAAYEAVERMAMTDRQLEIFNAWADGMTAPAPTGTDAHGPPAPGQDGPGAAAPSGPSPVAEVVERARAMAANASGPEEVAAIHAETEQRVARMMAVRANGERRMAFGVNYLQGLQQTYAALGDGMASSMEVVWPHVQSMISAYVGASTDDPTEEYKAQVGLVSDIAAMISRQANYHRDLTLGALRSDAMFGPTLPEASRQATDLIARPQGERPNDSEDAGPRTGMQNFDIDPNTMRDLQNLARGAMREMSGPQLSGPAIKSIRSRVERAVREQERSSGRKLSGDAREEKIKEITRRLVEQAEAGSP